MSKADDNEAFVRHVQFELNRIGQGLKVDGWAGSSTKAAFDIIIGRAIVASIGDAPEPGEIPLPAGGMAAARELAEAAVWAQPRATRPIREIILHCSATPEGRVTTVADIKSWHLARGFNDIGYHYVVHIDGRVSLGRPINVIGAHVEGHNSGTIGVCYIGGTDLNGKAKDTRTPAQKEMLIALFTELAETYPSILKISGHNQYDKGKACPCFNVEKDELGTLA
jgi:N-acetylmuramoyl-L-alanine amidase